MIRALVLLAVSAGGLGALPVRAQAPDAVVIPDRLNLRFGPGTEYAIVARLARETPLTLLGRDDVPDNGLWVVGRAPDGTEGWALADYLTVRADLDLGTLPVRPAPDALGTPGQEAPEVAAPVEAPEPASPAPATFPEGSGIPGATTSNVNFRGGPGTGYRAMTTLPGGTPILAKGRNAAATWVFASVGDQDGWLFGNLVRLSSGAIGALPITDTIVDAPAGGAGVPAPVAGGAGLRGFGYGAHVDSFAYPGLMHQAGMTWAKRQIRFTRGAPGAVAAGAIDQAHANGFKILLGIVGDKNDVLQPGYFEDYARFVGEVAALGPDAIEVWNEQNIDREWPNGSIDPGLYTQLLAQAYNAIKSANPNVAVISGAPAPTGAEGAFGTAAVWNDDRYVRGMAAAGAARYMDCIGAHYNEGIVSPSRTSGDPRGNYYTRYFWGMLNTYSSAFGGARPVCFTELGYLSPEGYGPLSGAFAWAANTTVAEQAQWVAEAVRLSRNSGRVRLVILWNMDFTHYGDDPMAGYALIRPGGGCPACDALAGGR
ncbi:MAG: SH3 domain-containing protein [Anaerolineae bacterium]|nr:SH3 domain-containing protein [Anaerolineae bacterium]